MESVVFNLAPREKTEMIRSYIQEVVQYIKRVSPLHTSSSKLSVFAYGMKITGKFQYLYWFTQSNNVRAMKAVFDILKEISCIYGSLQCYIFSKLGLPSSVELPRATLNIILLCRSQVFPHDNITSEM